MASEPLSPRLENELRFKEFYFSGEPETTANHPLRSYGHPVSVMYRYSENGRGKGEVGLYLDESVTTPGQMLIVENTSVSCACLRDYSAQTENPYAPTTLLSSPPDRIPPEVHKHLAHKFAKVIQQLEAATPNDMQDFRKLDARRHPPTVIPVNVHGGMDQASSQEIRGPWNEVAAGVEKTLDSERVWNIIANNAICYTVQSKSRERPSPVETCQFWGMWITPSFINHSCIPNCHAMRIGDAIIVRAARAMLAGEELTLPYFDIFQPLRKRELAAQRWGFRCECERCAFERAIGRPYEDVQEGILNLEQQMEHSSTFKNEEMRLKVAERLLQKLARQVGVLGDLDKALKRKYEDNDMAFSEKHLQADMLCFNCIVASFTEPFIAMVVLARKDCDTYEIQLPADSFRRTEKANKLRTLISSVANMLSALRPVHPGNLLCQEFYSILLKASNELVDYDLDENMTKDLASQNFFVTAANEFSRSYYGPFINCFESMSYGMLAFEL